MTDEPIIPSKRNYRDGRKHAERWWRGLSADALNHLSSHDKGALKVAFSRAFEFRDRGLGADGEPVEDSSEG